MSRHMLGLVEELLARGEVDHARHALMNALGVPPLDLRLSRSPEEWKELEHRLEVMSNALLEGLQRLPDTERVRAFALSGRCSVNAGLLQAFVQHLNGLSGHSGNPEQPEIGEMLRRLHVHGTRHLPDPIARAALASLVAQLICDWCGGEVFEYRQAVSHGLQKSIWPDQTRRLLKRLNQAMFGFLGVDDPDSQAWVRDPDAAREATALERVKVCFAERYKMLLSQGFEADDLATAIGAWAALLVALERYSEAHVATSKLLDAVGVGTGAQRLRNWIAGRDYQRRLHWLRIVGCLLVSSEHPGDPIDLVRLITDLSELGRDKLSDQQRRRFDAREGWFVAFCGLQALAAHPEARRGPGHSFLAAVLAERASSRCVRHAADEAADAAIGRHHRQRPFDGATRAAGGGWASPDEQLREWDPDPEADLDGSAEVPFKAGQRLTIDVSGTPSETPGHHPAAVNRGRGLRRLPDLPQELAARLTENPEPDLRRLLELGGMFIGIYDLPAERRTLVTAVVGDPTDPDAKVVDVRRPEQQWPALDETRHADFIDFKDSPHILASRLLGGAFAWAKKLDTSIGTAIDEIVEWHASIASTDRAILPTLPDIVLCPRGIASVGPAALLGCKHRLGVVARSITRVPSISYLGACLDVRDATRQRSPESLRLALAGFEPKRRIKQDEAKSKEEMELGHGEAIETLMHRGRLELHGASGVHGELNVRYAADFPLATRARVDAMTRASDVIAIFGHGGPSGVMLADGVYGGERPEQHNDDSHNAGVLLLASCSGGLWELPSGTPDALRPILTAPALALIEQSLQYRRGTSLFGGFQAPVSTIDAAAVALDYLKSRFASEDTIPADARSPFCSARTTAKSVAAGMAMLIVNGQLQLPQKTAPAEQMALDALLHWSWCGVDPLFDTH